MRGAQPALEVDGVFVMDGDSTIRACDFLSLEPKAELRAPIIDALLVQMQGTTTDVLVMSTLFAGKLFSHNGLRAVFKMCGTRKEDPKPWWVHAAADPSVLSASPWLFDRPSPWRYMLIPVATNDEGVVRGGGSPGDHWVFVVVELVSCRIAYCDSCLSVRSLENLLLHTVPFTQAAPILGPHTQLTHPPPKPTHACAAQRSGTNAKSVGSLLSGVRDFLGEEFRRCVGLPFAGVEFQVTWPGGRTTRAR